MKVSDLKPSPDEKRVKFSRRELPKIPNELGCYALTNSDGDILYVGQGNLRARMEPHLGDREKTSPTKKGIAFWFYYLAADDSRLNKIEGGWVQQCEDSDGEKPILNKVQPPAP